MDEYFFEILSTVGAVCSILSFVKDYYRSVTNHN